MPKTPIECCSHLEGGWCPDCVGKLLTLCHTRQQEIDRLRANLATLDAYYSRQLRNRRLDYEDGLPWWEDDR